MTDKDFNKDTTMKPTDHNKDELRKAQQAGEAISSLAGLMSASVSPLFAPFHNPGMSDFINTEVVLDEDGYDINESHSADVINQESIPESSGDHSVVASHPLHNPRTSIETSRAIISCLLYATLDGMTRQSKIFNFHRQTKKTSNKEFPSEP